VERKARSIERDISDSVEQTTGAPAEQLSEGKSPTDTVLESGEDLLADVIMSAPQKLLWLVYTSFLCFFLLAERAKVRRAVIALPARYSMRLQIGRALRDMRQSVSRYLLTISVINAVLGMAATAAFWATGLPNAPLWGTLVALLNFMPYVGPLIANAIVLAVGLAVFPAPGDAFVPVAALVFLNTMEGQFVTPTVVGKRWRISPLAVFVALTFGGWLWGAIGALVAAPVLIVALALFDRIAPRRRGPQRREIRPGRIGGPADGVAYRAPAG
jgi:predicted PurR-regulated permease PerM